MMPCPTNDAEKPGMSISQARLVHEMQIRDYDSRFGEPQTNDARRRRNKALAKSTAEIFRSIERSRPPLPIDFQI
jgi:hypothetical protein